jgi:hypothetical protein
LAFHHFDTVWWKANTLECLLMAQAVRDYLAVLSAGIFFSYFF